MEKNTVIAVVLSVIILIVFYVAQGIFFPPPPPQPVTQPQPQVTPVETVDSPLITEIEEVQPIERKVEQKVEREDTQDLEDVLQALSPQEVEYVTIDTDLISVTLTNAGGNIVSWYLKNYFEDREKTEEVNMIFAGDEEAQAFSIAFGGINARPITSYFNVNRVSKNSVEFYRDFAIPEAPANADKFRLTKRYDFSPSEYMFKLTVTLDGGYYGQGFDFAGNAYTLTFGPQIGPTFKKIDKYNEYRTYEAYINGKRKNIKHNEITNSQIAWGSITGKYFAFIAIPNIAQYSFVVNQPITPGIPLASNFSFIRYAVDAPKVTDTYHFYLGPKTQDVLKIYHTGENDFGFSNSTIVEVASSRGILAPLEKLLKWLLLIFYKLIPNYGVAIILLTLLVKIVFFPLTRKSSEATLRMQELSPKIKEIQEKYKDNKQKLNAEMGAFYQKEGYNPISGCLPMLLQIPVLFAMYRLFNNHFDLRGAEFIPGWIPDLSVPESIVNFPEGFSLPILGWTALRALPFIYVGSQLLYGKFTQTPGQQSGAQMKMMLYVMPVMFFFILYNMPSGLLIYWIFSNVLTLAQQVIINKYNIAKKNRAPVESEITPKKAGQFSAGQGSSGNKIAPKKKRRKF